MEEDSETPKQNIIYFLYRKYRSQIPWFRKHRIQFFPTIRWRARKNRAQKALFHKLRFQFFHSMGFRAWVSLEELEEIQAYDPEHWVWARDRATFPRAPGTVEA
ncbi:hypothetical protein H8957_006674 [Semnopithecus entellus]